MAGRAPHGARELKHSTISILCVVAITFRAEYASGELAPNGEEVVEFAWFDKEHLPEIPRLDC